MSQKVRGVIARSKGAPVTVETIVVPDPGPGEAIVAVQACGVCHTDLHYREGAINDEFPFLLGHEASTRSYAHIGVPEAHHPLSHHNNVPELIEKMSKINRYHADLFAKYVTRLSETKDGDRSLLDNITILYGAGLSNSNGHSGANLPQMLVGGGAGTWKGGRYLDFKDQPSQANLLLTIMDKFGVPLDKVGGSTGKLLLEPLGGV